MVGAEPRFSPRVGFVAENCLLPSFDEHVVPSYAPRFMGEQPALDLGFVSVVPGAIFPGLPLVGVVLNFR